jgi:hypothetical protein
MTRFADHLFDDLLREHGATLASTRVPPTPKRHLAPRPVLLAAGAGGLAVAATVGTLAAGGGTPAYAVTTHPDGTVTLAVYQESGIAGANAQLRRVGDDRVVVVPVGSGCPSIASLRAPAVQARQISVSASGSGGGSVTVDAHGIPAGDVLVLAFESTSGGQFSMHETMTKTSGQASGSGSGQASTSHQSGGPVSTPTSGPASSGTVSRLTSGPVPSCVSIPAGSVPAAPGSGGGSSGSGGPSRTNGTSGTGKTSGSSGGSSKTSGGSAGTSTGKTLTRNG